MKAFEARASTIASSLAGHAVSVTCADSTTWRALSSEYGFDRTMTMGLTPLASGTASGPRPLGRSILAPRTCRFGAAFLLSPTKRGSKICKHGTRSEWRRVPRESASTAERRRVRVEVPLLGECDDWGQIVLALHVLVHESMHLAGIVDEDVAECLAVQMDALVVRRLGAAPTFARSIASEYWRYYYASQDPRYRSADCQNGGTYDAFGSDAWPTPRTYPSSIARSIARFVQPAVPPA